MLSNNRVRADLCLTYDEGTGSAWTRGAKIAFNVALLCRLHIKHTLGGFARCN